MKDWITQILSLERATGDTHRSSWCDDSTYAASTATAFPDNVDPLAAIRYACGKFSRLVSDRPDCFVFMAATWNEILKCRDLEPMESGVGYMMGVAVHIANSEDEYRSLKWKLRQEGTVCVVEGDKIKLLTKIHWLNSRGSLL